MNRKLIILGLMVLLLASVANAQLKRTMGTAAVGTVVGADGAAVDVADYDTEPAVGIVIFNDGTNSLVANSGLITLTGHGFAAGSALTYNATGGLLVHTGDVDTYQPIVGYVYDANTIIIKFENQLAVQTEYTQADFLGAGLYDVQTVEGALDAIHTYLSDVSATYRTTVAITDTVHVGSNTNDLIVADIATAVGATFAEGDKLYLHFTGDFTDDISQNGAVINVRWGNGTGVVPTGSDAEINLMNYDFYQRQTITLLGQVTVGAVVGTYTILADGDSGYDGGRFVQGTLTVEKF